MTSVSVVIPAYNRRDTLPRAIESVFGQDHPIGEVIVIDDGSTDGTGDLPILRDDRITYLVNAQNLGSQGSRNRGIDAATGDAIAFLDSDDFWDGEKISKQLAAVARHGSPEVYAVTCGFTQFGETGGFEFLPQDTIHAPDMFVHNLIGPTSNLLISRSLFDVAGRFDTAMPSCQDWEMFMRILDHIPIFGVPEILVYQDTESSERISRNQQKVLNGHAAIFDRVRRSRAYLSMSPFGRLGVRMRQSLALRRRAAALRG